LPADLLLDPTTKNKTVFPFATPNSGTVKYNEHRRDLSSWVTLSYDDRRPTPKPKKVILIEPLAGDAERGQKIAMNTQQGNCWACHALPGDAQPGVGGPPLLAFKTRGYSNAHVYQQIYDARIANGQTLMPPYGTFGTLTDQNIRDLTAFLQSID
jgi:sulfur oxidation c-type cytochrome SoxX